MRHIYNINPRTGIKEHIVNAELYPAYLMLPEELFVNYPSLKNRVTRFPRRFLANKDSRSFVESDEFLELMIDGLAYLVWPTIAKMYGLCEYMEVYSGYDIAWKAAHAVHVWTDTMEIEGITLTPPELFMNSDFFSYYDYISMEEIEKIMERIVPIGLELSGFDKAIKVGIEYRCIEDFDFRNSNKKTDFHRKWYHSRTKLYKELYDLPYQKRSDDKTEGDILNELIDTDDVSAKEKKTINKDPENWNMIRYHGNREAADKYEITDFIETKVAVNDFLMQIPPEDYELLMMGFHGKTQKEIAEALNLKTHSAVVKRRQHLITEFEKFSGVEINKKAIRRKKIRKK